MNFLQINDLKKGYIQISWQRGNDIPRQYQNPVPFTDPLSKEDRKELRWYLEDYLNFPYGAERYRAEQLEKKMVQWGESMFNQVFIKGDPDPDPRSFYQEAVREGLDRCELCITSDDPVFLNIPWELIRDPTPGRGYLAPSLGGLYRQRTGQKIEIPPDLSADKLFRILLVIARPYGERDIPLGTVARPVLEALRPFRDRIHLEVLRPPTFDALQKRLNEQPYHLVHFDGHGVFVPPSDRHFPQFLAGNGHLVFEKKDGSENIVNSQDLGQALATSRVPLFVLNACQSAEEGGKDPFSSVASQLIAVGAKGVVAMSYSVYASTAAQFMGRFYEELIGHKPLTKAVADARKRLYAEPDKESTVGVIKLRDWMVPTLYQQERLYVPVPEEKIPAQVQADNGTVVLRQRAEEACPEGRWGFIGRDYDILRIERALRDDNNPWVLLSGIGGTGKTELAFGFARWYAETGGCPGGVFATSFKEKADFGQVIGSIAGYATDFSRLPENQQWQVLINYLRDNFCLLIWDNFETVAGYPQGYRPLAAEKDLAKLSQFLKALRNGKSRVLITTRKPDENWLGIATTLIEIGGLIPQDAGQLAKAILKTVGKSPEDFKDDPDYGNFLKLLKGHPRSLETVLPHLRTKSPREVIEALQYRVDTLGEKLEDASLSFAYLQMSPQTRRHLPFIGLFTSNVHSGILGFFVGPDGIGHQAYKDIMGESLDVQGWESVLEEAGRSGFLRPRGNGIYELHPTISPHLRKQLISTVGEEGLKKLDTEFMQFYASLASQFYEGVRNGEENAVAFVSMEEANLLRALHLAMTNETWSQAQDIVQTLEEFYECRGRYAEWNALRDRSLGFVGRDISADADRKRASLWMYLLGGEARQAMESTELANAETIYKRILNYLLSLNDTDVEPNIAVAFHQLGRIAQERQQFELAEQWYKKALEIYERLGLERDAADDYHQLGIIAQERQQFELAEQWYKKALEIYERLELERDATDDYHQLGMIAQERQQFELAEQWYKKALEIRERLRLERYAATDYHQLGMIAQERQQFELAEQWYKKALEIKERLGLEREVATDYHQLGMIAQERQQFELAEQWYKKALEIKERLGHPPFQITTLAQLGILYHQQKKFYEAVSWFGQALAIATDYKMQVGGQIIVSLVLTMKAMGEKEFAAAWRQAFEGEEPPLDVIREVAEKLEETDL